MNESESDFVCSSGRHLNISAFREFTEIPTEHYSVAKRAERTPCFPETHSSVQAYSFLTLLLTVYTKSLYICSFYTFPVNFSLQVDAPYIPGKRTLSQFAFKFCPQKSHIRRWVGGVQVSAAKRTIAAT